MKLDTLGTGEVARACRVAPRTVCLWIDSGKLPGYKIPANGKQAAHRRVTRAALVEFMEKNEIPIDGLLELEQVKRDPDTPEQWQEAVDMAKSLLMVHSAKSYGLVAGGPNVNVERCEQLLRDGARIGFIPDDAAVQGWIDAMAARGEPGA